ELPGAQLHESPRIAELQVLLQQPGIGFGQFVGTQHDVQLELRLLLSQRSRILLPAFADEFRHVFRAVDNAHQLAIRTTNRRVDTAPVALLETTPKRFRARY